MSWTDMLPSEVVAGGPGSGPSLRGDAEWIVGLPPVSDCPSPRLEFYLWVWAVLWGGKPVLVEGQSPMSARKANLKIAEETMRGGFAIKCSPKAFNRPWLKA